MLAALGDLLVQHSEIEDVEINPLRVTADGLLALDAILTMDKAVLTVGQGGPLLTRRTITPVAEGVTPWPEELARAYTERGWWRGRALGAELLAAADANPGAVALVDGDIRLTYRSLAARADELRAESPTLELVLVAGGPVRPGQVDLTALCAEPEDAGAHRARWDADQPSSRTVAVFLLSGGTTGLPKLITRTHDDYAYNARASAELCGLGPETVYLGTLPASHNFPLACPGILGTMLAGGRVVMLPSPEPQRVFATIAAEGVTVAAAVPAVAQRWLAHAAEQGADDVATLRLLQVGGARLADEVARTVRPVLGATLQQVFGMAEGLLRLDDPEDVICTTQGRPMSEGDEVRVVDELDRDVPDGTPSTPSWSRAPPSPSRTSGRPWPPPGSPRSSGPNASRSSPSCPPPRSARSTRRRCERTSPGA